jgi:virginiamycin B lyase
MAMPSPSPSKPHPRLVAVTGVSAGAVLAVCLGLVAAGFPGGEQNATRLHAVLHPTTSTSLPPQLTPLQPVLPVGLPPLPATTSSTSTNGVSHVSTVPSTAPPTTTLPDPCASPRIVQYAAGSTPGALAVGGDGNLWYSDPGSHTIDKFTPASPGGVVKLPLPAGDHAYDLTAGPDGNLWFTDPANAAIGRMTLSGRVTEFPTPTRVSNPQGVPGQTSNPFAITVGPDGALWFTESMADQIGRVTTTGTFSEYPLPSRASVHANPEAITVGPDGAVWFTEPLTGKLGRIDPASHAITEVAGVGGAGRIGGVSLAPGPDGRLWTDDVNAVASITTTGTASTYTVPDPNAWVVAVLPGHPGGNVVEADALAWALDQRGGHIDRITSRGNVTQTSLPGAAGHGFTGERFGMVIGTDAALWFTEGSSGLLARLTCG